MRVHWLQHAPFEGLGALEKWFLSRGHQLSATRLYSGESLPQGGDDFDWLVVMGGPMNIYQYRDYPWLPREKELIRSAIVSEKRVLGICLGAQLIADVLGAKIHQNHEREIGWFPILPTAAGSASPFAIPAETIVFHWHGDTFTLPPGSVWLAESAGCAHQAFALGHRVLALQFHLEMTSSDLQRIVQACADELTPARYVKTAGEIVADGPKAEASALALLEHFLTILERG